jgi:hypothetical protein
VEVAEVLDESVVAVVAEVVTAVVEVDIDVVEVAEVADVAVGPNPGRAITETGSSNSELSPFPFP